MPPSLEVFVSHNTRPLSSRPRTSTKKTQHTKKRIMTYEDAPDGREWTDNVRVCRHYAPNANALGGPGRLPTRYHATFGYDHEHPASGFSRAIEDFRDPEAMSAMPYHENHRDVDGQGMVRGWPSGATNSRSNNPEWHHTENPDQLPCTQPEEFGPTLHDNQLATPYDSERPWMGTGFPTGPWNPLASQEGMEGQSMLHACTTSYGQPPQTQYRLGGSAKSVLRRASMRTNGSVAMAAEISDRPYHDNPVEYVNAHRK